MKQSQHSLRLFLNILQNIFFRMEDIDMLKKFKTYDYAVKNWHNFIINRTLAFISDIMLTIFLFVFVFLCMAIFN